MHDTARATLRPIGAQDLAFLSDYYQRPEHVRYLPSPRVPVHQLLESREGHWDNHGFGTFLVASKGSGAPIGYCGVEYAKGDSTPDIRFGFIREVWGQGYAKEVARFTLELAFTEFRLPIAYGASLPTNTASLKVLEFIGMLPAPDFNCYGPSVIGFYATESML